MWLTLIDAPRRPHAAVVKLDVAASRREDAIGAVGALFDELSEEVHAGAALVGVSARFFRGALSFGRDLPGAPSRFGIARPPPRCLRRPRIRGDERWPAVSTLERIAANESDLLVLVERASAAAVARIERLARSGGLIVRDRIHCFHPPDGRTALGYVDGLSNLQDLRAAHRERYRDHVFVGEANGEHPAYAGGTYLVYRRYRLHLRRWRSDDFSVVDRDGVRHQGDDARDRAIGRARDSGEVVADQRRLGREPDRGEAALAVPESHVRHANPRGRAETQFGAAVVPRDVRVLRRSYRVAGCVQPDTEDMAFLCFQADIQRGGFEYINNQWLLPGGFMGRRDALMDPASGVVEPVDGCYYFVPREPDPALLFG